MIKKDFYTAVKTVIAATFSINENTITPQTSSEDIEQWDSLGHIHLILQLESTFNIKFNITAIPKLTSVNAIVAELKQEYEHPI